ncbi:MAG: hypothetical protein JWM99_5162 [Verrucomicrobiales bacterium]|nr:hypothetical protein [Verrucomicrobiales bacterium]
MIVYQINLLYVNPSMRNIASPLSVGIKERLHFGMRFKVREADGARFCQGDKPQRYGRDRNALMNTTRPWLFYMLRVVLGADTRAP